MGTVIIPAHNEASVIRRCLDSIINQQGVKQVIVACNACNDGTADIVRKHYPQVQCIEIDQASKVAALNAANDHATFWPRFYLDADTQLSEHAVPTIVEAMQTDDSLLLAAPTPNIDLSKSSWWVKQYYTIWLRLPYIREGVIATCSYVISEVGQKRVGLFPDVISDDGYVRGQFQSHELGNVTGASIRVFAPTNLWSLIKIKSRARLGNLELEQRQLCAHHSQKNYGKALKQQYFSKFFLATMVYVGISLWIRWRAQRQFKHLDGYVWEVDQSSR